MSVDFSGALIFVVIGLAFMIIAMVFWWLIRPTGRQSDLKLSTYECGEVPQGSAWVQFNIRFYVVALIFIIFDVEIIFLLPWAVVFKSLGMFAFIEGLIFIAILVIGLAYVWRKGDLAWVKPEDYGQARQGQDV
jgi:NADH-quinone oxidoreductase subunit A